MKFIIDAHLPRRLAVWLSANGHDAVHTLDLPAGNRTSDRAIEQFADAEDRIVVTKDQDFVTSFLVHGRPRQLLLISVGNMSNTALLALFESGLPRLTLALTNARYVELGHGKVAVHR